MVQGAAGQQGRDAVLPEGVRAVWDLDKAFREATPTRERVCINGLWRWQPAREASGAVPKGGWGYFKVPGPWPGITSYIQKDTQRLFRHPSWKNVNLASVTAAWYQREIEIPRQWAGRRIVFCTEQLNSRATVFIDGRRVGQVLFPGGEADISAACRPGDKHVLSLYVEAMPLSEVVAVFSDTGAPKQGRGRVDRRGLCGDAFLVSTPAGPRIDGFMVRTSVRNWEISFDTALKGLTPGATYRLRARITDGAETVKQIVSGPFSAADLSDGRLLFGGKWHPEKLWDIDTPENVYGVQLVLEDADGGALDVSFLDRFGFREFWIEGKDFYLNGTRFYSFIVPVDNALFGTAWCTYDAARESMLRLKSWGVNTVYTHNYGCQPGSHLSYAEILRAADDVGMLVAFSMPHMGHYDWDRPEAVKTNGYAEHAAFYVRMAGNHPSVVMYSMNHNALSYGGGSAPELIDGLHNERGEIGPRTDRGARRGLLVQSIVERLDPTRVVYHHSSANLGNMYTLNLYLNFSPIQEVSDWFEHWSREGVKPLLLCEYDTPYDLDWTMYRGWYKGKRSFGSAPVPWEFCVAEWNAQFLGDRAFRLTEKDKINLRWEAKQWKSRDAWHRWDYPYPPVGASSLGHKEKNEVRAMYITDNWRAFRTWGVSAFNEFGYGHFWSLREGAGDGRKNFAVDWDNIQRPGFSPDYIRDCYPRMDMTHEPDDWVAGAAAQALYRNNMPLLAYIAGKPEHFTEKGHNFLPGQTVKKQLIIINNSRRTVDCEYSWSLGLPRAVSGRGSVTIETGQQERIPLKLSLPGDLAPGSYRLSATFKFSSGEVQEDEFTVDVLSAPSAPRLATRIALFDPKGETADLLDGLGIRCDPVGNDADLRGYDVLVVGKEAITLDGPTPDISGVRRGLKVVMFEQTAEVLERRFGFRVEEYGLRRVFVRVPGHPLLDGLSTRNLRDWRGEATLLPPHLAGYEIRRYSGERLKRWCGIPVTRAERCGNWGSVASVLIEKPAVGDFLPIVDGGFSLQFSPLMVYREGKGLVVLCQLDVTGRTEQDPAAARLVANIFSYVQACPPAPERGACYVGEEAGRKHLQSIGLAVQEYNGGRLDPGRVLVVGPGGSDLLAGSADAVRRWLGNGGRLFALGLSGQEASSFLPDRVTTKKAEHICTVFEPAPWGSLLAGVGPADVHNRDPREIELVSGGATIIGNGVLALAAGGNAVMFQLPPWEFDYRKYYNVKRTFRRTAFLVTRVLANMGCRGRTPLLERFSSPVSATEKTGRWLEGFYLDKPEEFDDPYRSFGW